MDRWMDGCKDRRKDRWMVDRWMDGGWMKGWMDERMDGWMVDGWMDGSLLFLGSLPLYNTKVFTCMTRTTLQVS